MSTLPKKARKQGDLTADHKKLEEEGSAFLRSARVPKRKIWLIDKNFYHAASLNAPVYTSDGMECGTFADVAKLDSDYLDMMGRTGNYYDFVMPDEVIQSFAEKMVAKGSLAFQELANVFFTFGNGAEVALQKIGISERRRQQKIDECLQIVLQAQENGATCRELQAIFVKYFSAKTNAQKAAKNRKDAAKKHAARLAKKQLGLKLTGGEMGTQGGTA